MFRGRLQPEAISRRASALTLSAAFGILGAILLVAIPLVRTSELNEHGSTRERVEEPTLAHRIQLDRHLRSQNAPAIFVRNDHSSLGHSQRPVFKFLDGHRLTNGLLAPMTC